MKQWGKENPWMKLDGYTFQVNNKNRFLKIGQYPNGRGAIQVVTPFMGPDCTLTVNLVDEKTGDDQFWVKVGGGPQEVAERLQELGIIEPLGKSAGSGRVEHYADLWRLVAGKEKD